MTDLRVQIADIIVRKVLQEDYDDLVEGYLDEILLAADQIILLPAYKAVAQAYYERLASPVDGWQPIETLPGEMKNGSSRFLVAYTDGVVRVCRWLDNSKSDWPWKGVSPSEQIPMRADAKMTHWMPLPQPPNNERTE